MTAFRWLVAALISVALLAAGCSASESGSVEPAAEPESANPAGVVLPITDDMAPGDQVAAARNNWAVNGPPDYDLVVERLCEDPCPTAVTRNTVLNGLLVASGNPDGGFSQPQTMEDALSEAENVARSEMPSEKLLEFDPTSGAIVSIVLPFAPGVTSDDREIRFRLEAATELASVGHGASAAEAGCPDIEWQLVRNRGFDVSLPADMVEQVVEGVDSEVGRFDSDDLSVNWDFGQYSDPLGYWEGPVTVDQVLYSGIGARRVVATELAGAYGTENLTAVNFSRIASEPADPSVWNGLTLFVLYDDLAQAETAACIVNSIDWPAG